MQRLIIFINLRTLSWIYNEEICSRSEEVWTHSEVTVCLACITQLLSWAQMVYKGLILYCSLALTKALIINIWKHNVLCFFVCAQMAQWNSNFHLSLRSSLLHSVILFVSSLWIDGPLFQRARCYLQPFLCLLSFRWTVNGFFTGHGFFLKAWSKWINIMLGSYIRPVVKCVV